MSGPNFTTDVSISKGTPALFLDDTSGTAHTWELVATGETWQLHDVTNSATRILVDANGRVGIGASAGDLPPNLLTLKDSSTCLGMINGSPGARITGNVAMVGTL